MSFFEKRRHYKALFLVMTVVLLLLILITSMLGVADISIRQAAAILLHKLPIVGSRVSLEGLGENYVNIIWKLRLPRILLAGLVGVGLSVSGASFQSMFKNPMADPYVLGVSSGSALGATLAIVLGVSGIVGVGGVTAMAFVGAISTVFIVYNIARVGNKVPIVSLVLAGISVSYLFSAVISIMMIFNRTQVDKIVFWLMGSVSTASWSEVAILFPFVLGGAVVISVFSRDLNVMLLGDESATSLGIEVEKVKKLLLVVNSVIVAVSVSVSGIIGFVGLIIPHTIRLLLGPDNRALIPFSAVAGAIFMIASDTLARTIAPPAEIPVGAITSVFGAPYFIYLLIKNKRVK